MNHEVNIDEDILSMPLHTNGKAKKNRRSELAQEIVSRKPSFTEKWALLILLFILLLLFCSTRFIQYPDIIEARATLMAFDAPKEIIPRQEGRLVRLLSSNDQAVTENQVLGWIESTASHEEVIDLSSQIDSSIAFLNAGDADKVSGLFQKKYAHLGELQAVYQQFTNNLQLFNDYLVNGFYAQKRKMLEQDMASLHQMHASEDEQKALTGQDVKLAEESFKMNDVLLKEKVISKEEYRTEKSKFLNKEAALPQLNSTIISNENQQRDKQKEILQLDHDIAQQKITFEQALQTLKSNVDDWMKRFLLRSPIHGKVVFIIPLQENKFLQAGRLIGYIVPDDAQYYAELTLPQNNFGKIDTGLQVQLRFDAYPYQEFGFVSGKMNYISKVPTDSGFLATVQLNKGLLTNREDPILYKSGLKAQAIIITRKLSLFQRMYYNLTKTLSVKK